MISMTTPTTAIPLLAFHFTSLLSAEPFSLSTRRDLKRRRRESEQNEWPSPLIHDFKPLKTLKHNDNGLSRDVAAADAPLKRYCST